MDDLSPRSPTDRGFTSETLFLKKLIVVLNIDHYGVLKQIERFRSTMRETKSGFLINGTPLHQTHSFLWYLFFSVPPLAEVGASTALFGAETFLVNCH